ncbi:class I SAM-dependent methyltransferase [Plantactinospora sp. CA-290183]|uniref:class I SAM-dependent methyltransferase n=1 Tax=Plantactinospora sp. CA-290183 TaxID=3240006 RepID=UPI003D91770D
MYDRVAGRYEGWSWQEFWRRNERPLITELLAAEPVVRLALDVGIGTGAYVPVHRAHSERLVGIDISWGMLGVLRHRHPGVSRVVASATGLPFATGSFDRIVTTRVLSHVQDPDLFVAEARRVLTVGGSLIVSDVDPEHDYRVMEFSRLFGADHPASLVPYRHGLDDLTATAQKNGLALTRSARLRFSDLRWRPGPNHLTSIDRSDRRHVFYLAAFRKTAP